MDLRKPDLVALHSSHPLAATGAVGARHLTTSATASNKSSSAEDLAGGSGGAGGRGPAAVGPSYYEGHDPDARSETVSQIGCEREQEYWVDRVRAVDVRISRMRFAARFSGLAVVASCVLMIIYGLYGAKGAAESIGQSAAEVGRFFERGGRF